jgi:hypothetical protein
MSAERTAFENTLLELPDAEKRRAITLLARSLIVAGKVEWPDNTPILDESGRELGVVLIVESAHEISHTIQPEAANGRSLADDTIPIDELFTDPRTRERVARGGNT